MHWKLKADLPLEGALPSARFISARSLIAFLSAQGANAVQFL